eukprot:108500-Rhodomonas_salina.1
MSVHSRYSIILPLSSGTSYLNGSKHRHPSWYRCTHTSVPRAGPCGTSVPARQYHGTMYATTWRLGKSAIMLGVGA